MKQEYLVKGPIKAALVTSYLEKLSATEDTGAHSVFMGQVRADEMAGRTVRAIEYSAYDEMVVAEAERIIRVTKSAFSDLRNIVIVHSTGLVKAGEMSLFVLVTAGHRDQAFRGCRHVVEMIKINYPVWKKELFDDDSHRWRENT